MFEHRDVRVRAGFGNRMLPKPSCRVHGFGYFRHNESSSLAAEASETFAKALRFRHGRKWVPAFAEVTSAAVADCYR